LRVPSVRLPVLMQPHSPLSTPFHLSSCPFMVPRIFVIIHCLWIMGRILQVI
jgi:hypothetical protein